MNNRMELLRSLVFILGLAICICGTWLIWPGYWVHGRFYGYPVTLPLLATVGGGWLVVLGTTFLVLRRMKGRR
jgi:hypothetical protein